MVSQRISGKRVKLDTDNTLDDRNSFIYDDTIPGESISENGHHEDILILIDNQEIIFDNHHSQGIARNDWMSNLQFFGKIHLGQTFQVSEEDF